MGMIERYDVEAGFLRGEGGRAYIYIFSAQVICLIDENRINIFTV